MARPDPLPREMAVRAFTVAQARAFGVRASRLRRVDLERPFHGVRTVAGPAPTPADLLRRCQALLIAAPAGAFFSHLTAAQLWPLPLPPRLAGAAQLHLALRHPARAVRRAGVVGHTVHDPSTTVITRRGLPTVDPTSCSPARRMRSPESNKRCEEPDGGPDRHARDDGSQTAKPVICGVSL